MGELTPLIRSKKFELIAKPKRYAIVCYNTRHRMGDIFELSLSDLEELLNDLADEYEPIAMAGASYNGEEKFCVILRRKS